MQRPDAPTGTPVLPTRRAGAVLTLVALGAGMVALLTWSFGPAYVGLVVGAYGLSMALPRTAAVAAADWAAADQTTLRRIARATAAAALIVVVGLAAQLLSGGGRDVLSVVFGLGSIAIAVTLAIIHAATAALAYP